MYQCMCHRALKPGHILPEVSEDVKRLMQPPESVRQAAARILEKIDRLFKREELVAKKEKVTGEQFFAEKGKR